MSKKHEEPEDNAEEQHCHLVLAELRKHYELAAKPYIDRLAAIKSLRMPDTMSHDKCEWKEKAKAWMASPEAAAQLDGYRELGAKVAALEAENNRLREALAMNEPKP